MSNESTEIEYELRLKLYAEARADLLKRQLSNSENADRAILSVSTAALGFSLAFLKDIIRLNDAEYSFLLYLSWALFVFSVIVTLLSFFTSQKAIDEQLEIAHKYYIESDSDAIQARPKCAKITEMLNKVGAILLVLGLLCTCIFVGFNLSKGKTMTTKGFANDGAIIPSMQKTPQGGNAVTKGATIPALQSVPANPNGGATIPTLQKTPSPPSTGTSK